MSRAAYMREYRAKRSIAKRTLNAAENIVDLAAARIDELEAEVARLKRELAARPIPAYTAVKPLISEARNPYAEFHPAPKVRPKK